jgi:hypothetical protein
MQNEFLHNIQHVEIHRLADIDVELHISNDSNNGEDFSNTIMDLLPEEVDSHGHLVFHAIERTMKPDTTRSLFAKQNDAQCNAILKDIDNWLCSKFIDAKNNVSFRHSSEVRLFTSPVYQRKTQHQVKFNAYETRIAKRFCSENPNEAVESFDTAPNRMPKRCINLTYTAAAAKYNPIKEQSAIHPLNASEPMPIPMVNHDAISISSNDNSSRLAELELSLKSIHSERLSLQSDHQSLRADFQKVVSGVLQHSKEIQAM